MNYFIIFKVEESSEEEKVEYFREKIHRGRSSSCRHWKKLHTNSAKNIQKHFQ